MRQFRGSIEEYVKETKERMITEPSSSHISRNNLRINKKSRLKNPKKQKWEEKQQYRYFKRQTKEIAQRDDLDIAGKRTLEEKNLISFYSTTK